MNVVKKFLKNTHGFTLIEAIISVVILGLAILPISMVFTRTIGQTINTNNQLEANELATKYMEAVKDKSFREFNSVFYGGADGYFPNGSIAIEQGDDLSIIDLDPVPVGYRIIISYDDASLYNASYDTPVPAGVVTADGIIEISSGSYQKVVYRLGDGSLYNDTSELVPTEGVSRKIDIVGSRADNSITIKHSDAGSNMVHKMILDSLTGTEYALRFDIGKEDTHTINTTIEVTSDMTEKIQLYFYEEEDNTVQPIVDVQYGYIGVSRNLYLIENKEPRITQVTVDVIKISSGETLASLSSSKVNE